MIFIILYLLSYPLILYDNFFSMRLSSEKSRIANAPSFFIIVQLITYGSMIGLWFEYGWKAALLSFIMSWTFNKLTFRFYFKKYIHQTAQRLIKSDSFEIGLSEEDRSQKAYEFAKVVALRNATGKT